MQPPIRSVLRWSALLKRIQGTSRSRSPLLTSRAPNRPKWPTELLSGPSRNQRFLRQITRTFIPGSRPFDLFDADRKGRIKLYVKRVFITDEADVLPRYLRFVRGLVDSADLPLNISREMIQESPILTAIQKGGTSRLINELEKLAANEPGDYAKIWENFGAVLKEGRYEDFERRDA